MDQASTKWGSGLKANEGNVSATEPSRTLRSRGRAILHTSAFPFAFVTRRSSVVVAGAVGSCNGSPEATSGAGLVVHVIKDDSDD